MIIHDDILNSWVIYSAHDFMARFNIIDDLENWASDGELIEHHLSIDKRTFKIDFRYCEEYKEECWVIDEIKIDQIETKRVKGGKK